MKKDILLLMLCLFCSIGAMAQTKTITGVVSDAAGEPIIGASVVEVGTTNGTITDIDGKFVLNMNPDGKIRVSYIGYQVQTIDLKGKTSFRIQMKEDSEMLEEVVVTGYGGKQLRTKVTNSISKVKEETLKQGLYSNPGQALSGAVAGLSVSQTSGNPGSTPTLVLRGGTNFDGSGSPLILIDGQVRSSLSDINPDDIESMEVLKDAGATAIYGARANDGVILVTTKRGKSGRAEVNLKAKFGLNYFKNSYEFLDAGDYIYWMRMGYKNAYMGDMKHPDGSAVKAWSSLSSLTSATPYGTGNAYFASDGVTPLDGNKTSSAIWSTMKYTDNLAFLLDQGWQTMIDPIYGDKLIYKNTDIADFNVQTPAFSQDYNLSVSGGNEKGNYYAGLGYNKSDGTAYGNWYKRITFTFNADYKLKEWLTSSSSFNFADATWNGLPATQTAEANYFSRCLSLPPTFRGYNADGEMLLGPNSGDGNQQYNFDKFVRDQNTDKFTMNQSFTVNFMKGLSLKLGAIWYYQEEKDESFNKDYLSSPGNKVTSRSTSAYYDRTLDQTYNAVLNYNYQINKDHYLDAMAGFEYYDSYNKGFNASGSGAPTDDFMDLQYTSKEEGKRSIDSWHSRQRIMSFFGRVNYDYNGKYLFSISMRADGSSRFAEDNKWGFFPGVSAGWNMHRENFYKPLEAIVSRWKWRASWGRTGNNNLSVANSRGEYKITDTNYQGSVGILNTTLKNSQLRWETTESYDIGVDLGFFNNRLGLLIDYYNKLTFDRLYDEPLWSSTGFSSIKSNYGSVRNSGVEIELNATPIQTKDFSWDLGLTFAYNKGVVVDLPDNGEEKHRVGGNFVYDPATGGTKKVGGIAEGERFGGRWAFHYLGTYQTEEEAAKAPNDPNAQGRKKHAGDAIFEDVNNDGQLDSKDMIFMGYVRPDKVGGIINTLKYKGLTVRIVMDWAMGHVIDNGFKGQIMGSSRNNNNAIKEAMTNSWQSANDGSKYPKYTVQSDYDYQYRNHMRWDNQIGSSASGSTNNSLYFSKGDYLAFREVSLSYMLPLSWIRKMRLSAVEVFAGAYNIGYIKKYDGMFPEIYTGVDYGIYPRPRQYNMGVKIKF